MVYIALIGDIMGSRALANRAECQGRLQSICSHLNENRDHYGMASPLTLTLGDEFQALFDSPRGIWQCIAALESTMYPVNIRFALGVGEIVTGINREAALAMDGPAFHRARDAMDRLKKEKGRYYRVAGPLRCRSLVDHSLDLLSHHRAKWKQNRLMIFAGLLAGKSIGELKVAADISEQAVYRNIRDGALDRVQGILDAVAGLMAEAQLEETGRAGNDG